MCVCVCSVVFFFFWYLGGGFRGGSRIDGRGVLVGLASHGSRAQARQLGGSGGMPPQENFGFQEF